MNNQNLNLTRKWRSKNFDQVIGQDLSVRVLKNSLYKGHFFPVYLFSGQRGCGKTSTARIFASALNCEQLEKFQTSPQKNVVPCLTCASCVAMRTNQHPDFFEIDAASHTGVDNIRQIIDASSLMPLMGRKKIYLIDEAHMLSKAAFNAFLKILEEPPPSVVFILATTDTEKIIDTVKSRCFQLFFKPVESTALFKHLHHVCQKESIKCEDDALNLIIREAGGSVRDALNMLEQVRFSSSVVSIDAVQKILGHIGDNILVRVVQHVVQSSPATLLSFLKEQKIATFSASFIWRRLLEVLRALLWLKNGVSSGTFEQHESELKAIARSCSWDQLTSLMKMLYNNELVFQRTTAQYELLEMILLRMCQGDKDDRSSGSMSNISVSEHVVDDQLEEECDEEDEDIIEDEEVMRWASFVEAMKKLNKPLLSSIFVQARVNKFDQASSTLSVIFSHKHLFFKELIIDMQDVWKPQLKKFFSETIKLDVSFDTPPTTTQNNAESKNKKSAVVQPHGIGKSKKVESSSHTSACRPTYQKGSSSQSKRLFSIDTSDEKKWEKTHLLLKYFPGTVSEIRENK